MRVPDWNLQARGGGEKKALWSPSRAPCRAPVGCPMCTEAGVSLPPPQALTDSSGKLQVSLSSREMAPKARDCSCTFSDRTKQGRMIDQPRQMGQGGYLDVETSTVLAVQTGRDGRQGDDAGEAGLGQVQLLGQVERQVHLAGGEGRSHRRALEDRLVSRAPGETALPSP